MLAIIAAFKEEVEGYLKSAGFRVTDQDNAIRFYQSSSVPDVVVAEGGVGRQQAEVATEMIIKRYSPSLIICAGFAGGVKEGAGVGDLFICDKLYSLEGPAPFWSRESATEKSLADAVVIDRLLQDSGELEQGYEVSGCLSVPDLASGSSMKDWIGTSFPVSIIDMESYWVSEVAAAKGVRHVVVRSVSDPLEQTLPAFVSDVVSETRSPRWTRAAGYLLKRPLEARTLMRLAKQTRMAKNSLGKLLTILVSQMQQEHIGKQGVTG